jgi:hypothetical protein
LSFWYCSFCLLSAGGDMADDERESAEEHENERGDWLRDRRDGL